LPRGLRLREALFVLERVLQLLGLPVQQVGRGLVLLRGALHVARKGDQLSRLAIDVGGPVVEPDVHLVDDRLRLHGSGIAGHSISQAQRYARAVHPSPGQPT